MVWVARKSSELLHPVRMAGGRQRDPTMKVGWLWSGRL